MFSQFFGGGGGVVRVEAVVQGKAFPFGEDVGVVVAEGCTYPAVVAHVENGGVAGVVGMVEEGNAVLGVGSDRAGVVDPGTGFPVSLGFILIALGVLDMTVAVAHGHGGGNA